MAELDYASIMKAGQGLVPDLRAQMMENQQFKLQQQQQQLALSEQQRAIAEQAAFKQDLAHATQTGDPRQIAALMAKYPKFAAALKPGWDAMRDQGRQTALTTMGSIYARAKAGDRTGAAAILEKRINADKAAGNDVGEDEQILAALRSNDPQQHQVAIATIGTSIAAADPDKFAETYGKLFPTDAQTQFQKEYEYRVGKFGQAAADQWKAVEDEKFIPVDGVGVYRASDLMPKGGDQTSTVAGPSPAPTGAPTGFVMPVEGGTFTSGMGDTRDGGTRKHNGQDISVAIGAPVSPVAPGTVVKVGSDAKSGNYVVVKHGDGSTTSYAHLGDVNVQQGATVAPGQALGKAGITGNARAKAGNGVVHLVYRDKGGKARDPRSLFRGGQSGPVAVRSIQEAMKLAPGTHYIRPDGKEMIR